MEGAEERRRDRESALQAAAQVQPAAQVAAMRRELEAAEREMTETLRAGDAEYRASIREDVAVAEEIAARIRAELLAMSPAERAMPALIARPGTTGPSATGYTMATRDSQEVQRVLAHDFDFWRARRSPVEVRSIAINIHGYLGCGGSLFRNVTSQVLEKLDWAALNALLEPPR